MNKLNSIEWKIVIDGKPYASKIILNTVIAENRLNHDDGVRLLIKHMFEEDIMPTLTFQIISSVQKIITGKTDVEALTERAMKKLESIDAKDL